MFSYSFFRKKKFSTFFSSKNHHSSAELFMELLSISVPNYYMVHLNKYFFYLCIFRYFKLNGNYSASDLLVRMNIRDS